MGKASDLGGITAMLAATAAYVVGDSFMKIVIEDLPPFEVLFLRGIAASLACAVLVAVRGEWGALSGMLNVRALLRAAGSMRRAVRKFCKDVIHFPPSGSGSNLEARRGDKRPQPALFNPQAPLSCRRILRHPLPVR